MTGSYELANSISDFSHYMLGAEPSVISPPFKEWISALAKDPSINGAQIGKVVCNSAMKNYTEDKKLTHMFSVIDLTKMPELREAYEEYFDEALKRSNEDKDFIGIFTRAAEARNVDKYSNYYTDLGLLAKNTKSIMPKESDNLLKAIDKAVVYSKRGSYLQSKGISTYYPYISREGHLENAFKDGEEHSRNLSSTIMGFNLIKEQNSNYSAQKKLYEKILATKDMSPSQDVPLEKNSSGHFVVNLTPEQLENISSISCTLIPIKPNENSKFGIDIGGSILNSTDDLKIDFKKGTVTENFRAVEPVFDDHKILMIPMVSGRGHTLYKVPIIYNDNLRCDLIVRYDTSTKKYSILGFGSIVENGMVRDIKWTLQPGFTITPLYVVVSDDPSDELVAYNAEGEGEEVSSIIRTLNDPETGKTFYLKLQKGTPFVYTRDSAITNRQITKGDYAYMFLFGASSGDSSNSQTGFIHIENGKVLKITREEFELLEKIYK